MNLITGHVYKIVNDIDEKIYIGSTQLELEERLYDHLHVHMPDPRNQDRKLYTHIKSHGVDHFKIELIDTYYCKSLHELEHWEDFWIQQHRSHVTGLNGRVNAPYKNEDEQKSLFNKWKIDVRKYTRAVRYLKRELKVAPRFLNQNLGSFTLNGDLLMCDGKEVIPKERVREVLEGIDTNPLIVTGGRDSFHEYTKTHFVGISKSMITDYLKTRGVWRHHLPHFVRTALPWRT